MYRNILIPTDGSELAGKAVECGIELARTVVAKVTFLTVTAPFHVFTADTHDRGHAGSVQDAHRGQRR